MKAWSRQLRYQSRRRCGFTLTELLVVIAIIGLLVGITLPAVQAVRKAAQRTACENKLRQLSIAMLNYQAAHRRFPPGQLAPTDVKSLPVDFDSHQLVGHLAYAFPYVELDSFRSVLADLDWNIDIVSEAWYHNAAAWKASQVTVLPVLRCPADAFESPESINLSTIPFDTTTISHVEHLSEPYEGWTNYVGCSGDVVIDGFAIRTGGIFYSRSKTKPADISDGQSNTILLGETIGGMAKADGKILGPATRRHSFMSNGIGSKWGFFTDVPDDNQDTTIHTYSSRHLGQVANFAFADGHIRPIASSVDLRLLSALMTREGGDSLPGSL